MRKHRPERLPLIGVMALLSGCVAENSSGRLATPPLVDYSRAFQAHAAEELEALAPACPLHAPNQSCSALARLVDDYGELRARIRTE